MKKQLSVILLIATLFFAAIDCSAEGVDLSSCAFRHVGSSEGMTSGNVKCILQDSHGFMWFGTKNGLNRFDGTHILSIDVYDKDLQIGDNNICALYEDSGQRLWIGTNNGVYIFNPFDARFTFLDLQDPDGYAPTNWVQCIEGDSKGNVWILIPEEGIFRFRNGKLKRFSTQKGDRRDEVQVTDICVEPDGNVIATTSGGDIFVFDVAQEKFKRFEISDEDTFFSSLYHIGIVSRGHGQYVVSSIDGYLYEINLGKREVKKIKYPKEGELYVRDIKLYGEDIVLASATGVIVVKKNLDTDEIKEDPADAFSISDNVICTVYSGTDGKLWIGTMYGGVNYILEEQTNIRCYSPASIHGAFSSKRIRCLEEGFNGEIWVSSEESGIDIFNPYTGEVRRPVRNPSEFALTVMMKRYDNNMYIGVSHSGLDVVSSDGEVRAVAHPRRTSDNTIYSYLVDSHGGEWLGSGRGLYLKKSGESDFRNLKEFRTDWIFDILEATDGTIWVATMGNGIWEVRTDGKMINHIANNNGNGLRSNSVSSVMEDSDGMIWFSTDRGGIVRFDPKYRKFKTFGKNEGLPDDVCYRILEDIEGNLWFGTNRGLVRFNKETEGCTVYTTANGLPGNQFNYHSALKGSDGRFYFGTTEGLFSIDPVVMNGNNGNDIWFTNLIINGVDDGDMKSVNPCVFLCEEIVIPADAVGFSLDLSTPGHGAIIDGDLLYALMQSDKEDNIWHPVQGSSLSIAALPSGKYNLKVKKKGSDVDSVIKIRVLPKWWETWWFNVVIIIGIIVMAACVSVFYKRRQDLKYKEKEQLLIYSKEKELYENKLNFFTTIAHEIRTPLTLIKAPMEELTETISDNGVVLRYIEIMRQNVDRLLSLCSQLLDFQKMNHTEVRLKIEKTDISYLLRKISNNFKSTFTYGDKAVDMSIPEYPVYLNADSDAISKIISNLLGNALKYSDRKARISLISSDNEVIIKVENDGTVIPETDMENIFRPFFRLKSNSENTDGVGVGLPFARSLARLHGGDIEYSAATGELVNVFTLTLPVSAGILQGNDDAMSVPDGKYIIDEESELADKNRTGSTLMLVEDNQQMRDFLATQLADGFTVVTASNGMEGLEKLKEYQVDIIVTDIMMPVMDGYEFCRKVKENIEISHIPVVMLTAKNRVEDKIAGMKCGAEVYVDKPFSMRYLREQIKSILENRRLERMAFSKKPFFPVEAMNTTKTDEAFMQKVIGVIEENITDENFGVEKMAEILLMSRSTLQRKIKQLFNLSPVEVVRLIRLKKAAALISEGSYRIGEVVFMVGINSPSYFSKLFFQQFGMTPKDFEKQQRAKRDAVKKESEEGI